MKIINPASQEVIADVTADSPGDVARKVDQARSAGPGLGPHPARSSGWAPSGGSRTRWRPRWTRWPGR